MTYNTTLICIEYNSDALQFTTDDEYRAFLQALGRMVIYGMRDTDEPLPGLTVLGVDSQKEITGMYYHAPDIEPALGAIGSAQRDSAAVRRPFVMGAIPHAEGDNPDEIVRYSYHS